MTKLLASTALVAMLVMPAFAQSTTDTTTPPTATGDTAAPAETGTAPAPSDNATTATEGATGSTTMSETDGFGYMIMDGDMSAETFLGKRLYVSEADVAMDAAPMNEPDEGWDDIGEIGDLVLSKDGQLKAVIVDIGGFLGMGEKSVSVAMDQLRIVQDGDTAGDYFVVFTADRAALESAPEFSWPEAQQ